MSSRSPFVVPARTQAASDATVAASSSPSTALLGGRYSVINTLAHGGIGSVYRALDRLTGRIVILKRLRVEDAHRDDPPPEVRRLALAREFSLLGSLRHPNIIGVLDYGFDEALQPFFTMDLEENGQTIVDAGRDQPLALQVDLLVQALRAFAYVHRRNIVHRDVKPDNLLVVNGQVKLLDFGLSMHREHVEHDRSRVSGTFAYLAPEMLQGSLPTPRSDLFAFGVVTYELFTGRHPFDVTSSATYWERLMSQPPPLPADGVDSRLEPILARLLAKKPADRFGDAAEIVEAMEQALDRSLAFETLASRESFLQSAAFVGRDAELARLADALQSARRGLGGTWLVGGESGVGKSRLLDELRLIACVQGVVVARGQASNTPGKPYEVWTQVLRTLVLRVPDLDTRIAASLKMLVTDVADLLGRPVDAPPEVDADAAQTRLLFAVEELLRCQPGTVIILLEDLQWAGSESVRMLVQAARAAATGSLLIVGSYRTDERPDLPTLVSLARPLALRRLEVADTTQLVDSMLGAVRSRPRLIEWLQRETEGIPFYLVEVMRSLADEAGSLDRISESHLPRVAISGGIERVLRRRIGRVPPAALPLLKLAAVISREIDQALLQPLAEGLVVADWATGCTATGMLEADGSRLRFAHDKLREQLLADLGDDERRLAHRRVAEATAATYPESAAHWASLAHHWGAAGDHELEAAYAEKAGFLALASGACEEAIEFFSRAVTLIGRERTVVPGATTRKLTLRQRVIDPNAGVDPSSTSFRLARLEAGLTEAHFRLGDLMATRVHAIRTMSFCALHVPGGGTELVASFLHQLVRRALQVVTRFRSDDPEQAAVAREMIRVQVRLSEAYFFSLEVAPVLWLALAMINQCSPYGPSPELSKTHTVLGVLAGAMPVHRLARRWCRRAVEIGEQVCSHSDLAYVLTRVNNYRFGQCQWSIADPQLEKAARLADEVGDRRAWEEARSMQGMSALFQARFADGVVAWADAQRSCERSGNWQIECWALMGQADNLIRLGRNEEATALYRRALDRFGSRAQTTERIWALGMLALATYRLGDGRAAGELGEQVLRLLTMRPVAYWTQYGTAATTEVFLLLAEEALRRSDAITFRLQLANARRASAALRAYARVFWLGRPFALLWSGLDAALCARPRRAARRWKRCSDAARALGTPYELARVHLEIGRHLAVTSPERREYLERAAAGFRAQDAEWDLRWATRELERTLGADEGLHAR